MAGEHNAIEAAINAEATQPLKPDIEVGTIEEIVNSYKTTGNRLLGFLLDMSYDELQIVTCDAWKQLCGGVPKNSFVIIKLSSRVEASYHERPRLILARITDAVPTPIKQEIQQTIFQIHRLQAPVDPITNEVLQWAALKGRILGTYYDHEETGLHESESVKPIEIAFGNDIDSFFSPHFYEVYVPADEDLSILINSFVANKNPIPIGKLRYTETLPLKSPVDVDVMVSPEDFIKNRTALFGKTRMGKSNTIKVIADNVLLSGYNVAQVIFDPSGEYTYFNPQDNTSIYLLHRDRCTRYSLNPRRPREEEVLDTPVPTTLRANFYNQVVLGHEIIRSLYDLHHSSRPDYIAPLLAWDPIDPSEINERFPPGGDKTRYLRTLNMYYALLYKAGFHPPNNLSISLHLNKNLRIALATEDSLRGTVQTQTHTKRTKEGQKDITEISEEQNFGAASRIYEILYRLYQRNKNNVSLFPPSKRTGQSYFDSLQEKLLQMLGNPHQSGPIKLTPFVHYHDPSGIDIMRGIVGDVRSGKTVIIDLSNTDEVIAGYYSKMICNAILRMQMDNFANNLLGDQSILFYFEEAHNLFKKDDSDLTNIYNKLAKEGAKFGIGMVYATQSMTTMSPDLIKNTENYFIAHLNDDREIKELERRYEFRDIALDVQRSRTKGYVRMITLSHRFALPVQIRKFEPRQNNPEKG